MTSSTPALHKLLSQYKLNDKTHSPMEIQYMGIERSNCLHHLFPLLAESVWGIAFKFLYKL